MRCAAVVILFVGMTVPAAAEERWLCVGEQSTGFIWLNSKWQDVPFSTDTDRYIVQSLAQTYEHEGRVFRYEVKQIGQDFTFAHCERLKADSGEDYSRIFCGGPGRGFILDVDTLRFSMNLAGTALDKDQSETSPASITIGACTKL